MKLSTFRSIRCSRYSIRSSLRKGNSNKGWPSRHQDSRDSFSPAVELVVAAGIPFGVEVRIVQEEDPEEGNRRTAGEGSRPEEVRSYREEDRRQAGEDKGAVVGNS